MNHTRVTLALVAIVLSIAIQPVYSQQRSRPASVPAKLEDLVLNPKVVSADDLNDQEYAFVSRAALLRGWDKDNNKITEESCVEGGSGPSKTPILRDVNYSEVYDRETINQALKLSAEATYGAATGKASYARTIAIDRSSRLIIGLSSISGGGEVVASAGRLSTRALGLLGNTSRSKTERLNDFFALCGDSWISEIKNGGELSTVFRVALNNETIQETFKLSGAGGSGAFKTSAEIEASLRNEKEQTSIKFDQRRWGGPAVVASSTAIDVMTQLLNFSNSQDITPFTVVVSNYQSLGNWPPEFKYTSLSPRIRRLLSGHISRLRALEEVYVKAATEPSGFYFPFAQDNPVARSRQLTERADVLSHAARCLENVINYCSRMSQCYSTSVLMLDNTKGLCPALDNPEPKFNALVAAAVLGTNPKDLPANAPKQLLPALQRVAADFNRTLGTRVLTAAESDLSPATVYYQLLAESPLRRNWNPDYGSRDIADDTKQIEFYCAFLKTECSGASYEKISGKTPSANADPTVMSLYRQWVIVTRLLPVRGSFCKIDTDHPMCRSLSELTAVRDRLVPQFGEDRNFGPSPAQVTPPKRRPEVPCKISRGTGMRDCGGGLI